MIRDIHPFIPLLILIPFIMAFISSYKYKKTKKVEFKHLIEFFFSQSFVATISWFFWPKGPAFIIISMIPWVWTLRTIGLIFQDLTGTNFYYRTHYYILGVGSIVSIILLSFSFPLTMIIAPFSACVGLIGLTFFFHAYQKMPLKDYSHLHHFNFILFFVYFVSQLSFSIWISESINLNRGLILNSYLVLLMCACVYPLYAEIIFERHEQFLEGVLETRNKQLFSHSGFSEYKILAAGVTHEVNNSLTIINLKIERLINGSSTDIENDYRTILKNSNKIVKIMRGLREFIYPHDVDEKLETQELINEVLSLYGQRLANHGVIVQTEGLKGKYLKGHRIQLEQVFLSLINNSVDAIDKLDDKWIRISGKQDKDIIEITVKDSSDSRYESLMNILEGQYLNAIEIRDDDIRLIQTKDIIEKHGGTLSCSQKFDHSNLIVRLPVIDPTFKDSFTHEDNLMDLH